nr:hypothetical protein [Tanacetum cinerariifolium]
ANKTYLAYATGATTPKNARKFNKLASPSKKRTLVTIEEEEHEPAKKVILAYKSETLLVKKVLRRSRRDTTIHQADGSGDGTGDTPGVLDEPKDYVPIDDETNDKSNDVVEEEYERISKELYVDANVRLTDVEPGDEEKGNKEMTNAETVDDEHENVNQ